MAARPLGAFRRALNPPPSGGGAALSPPRVLFHRLRARMLELIAGGSLMGSGLIRKQYVESFRTRNLDDWSNLGPLVLLAGLEVWFQVWGTVSARRTALLSPPLWSSSA